MTAKDLLEFGVIDSIIPEPLGAAHRSGPEAIQMVGDAVEENIRDLDGLEGATLRGRRRERFLTLGNEALTA